MTIGFNETIHTACRGEHITTVMINNTNFGMTGGQASATTLVGQVTTTTPMGRKAELTGYPLHAAEIVAKCDGTAYSARVAITDTKNIRKTKEALRKAFEIQLKGLGYAFCGGACLLSHKLAYETCRSYRIHGKSNRNSPPSGCV